MQIAIVVYPAFTALDVIGPYEVLGRMPGAEIVFVAEQAGLVTDDAGRLTLQAVDLDDVVAPDVVLIGGGPGQPAQMVDGRLREWLRSADRTSTWTSAVCTGTLILAGAGLLDGREAATHWLATEKLAELGVMPSTQRVVVDGKYATGAGVSAGIDMALTLAGLIVGDETAQAIQLIVEYSPQPPYDAGTPQSAPAHLVTRLTDRRQELLGHL